MLESTFINVYVSVGVCVCVVCVCVLCVCVCVCVCMHVYNSNRFQTGEYQCPGMLLFSFFIDGAVKKGEKGFPVL
jgi:hypothetical protein